MTECEMYLYILYDDRGAPAYVGMVDGLSEVHAWARVAQLAAARDDLTGFELWQYGKKLMAYRAHRPLPWSVPQRSEDGSETSERGPLS